MSTPVQGWDPVTARYYDLHVDANGNMTIGAFSGALPAGANAIGSVTVSNLPATQPVSAATSRLAAVAAATVLTASGQSGNLAVGGFRELAVLVNVTAASGTSPSIAFVVEMNDSAGSGAWYPLLSAPAITAVGLASYSIGSGFPSSTTSADAAFGDTVRVRYVVTGTTPSFTSQVTVIGK
ncbi:MAG: hypothetical protein NVSMB19_18600 [Vulcanimicrobiaceae bacterium]